MEKKNVVLLTVIAVATLLITVVGATFAWYAANIDNSENEEINIKSSEGLAVTFDDGDKIEAQNIIPGWTSAEKKVTVSNTSDYELEYTIKWIAVTNEIADKENLKYSATVQSSWIPDDKHTHDANSSVSQIENNATPTKIDEVFAKDQKIKPGEQITYTITLNYADIGEAQGNPEESKSFTAKLSLINTDVKVISTTASKPTTD